MTVKILSRKTGIAAATLYSFIRRNTSARYDSALKLPIVDQLITDLYMLDGRARKDLFNYVKALKDNYLEPSRAEDLKKIKYKR